jgi:polyisoprenyl-phosphate glycosyltransferase
MSEGGLCSLIIPVYGNSGTIAPLIEAIEGIGRDVDGELEVIFVVDGSPDDSRAQLLAQLPSSTLSARVAEHSRNFGSFAAIRTGMSLARGSRMAVMAADLQEPPQLVVEFLRRLGSGEVDVVAGERASRDDRGDGAAKLYWRLYRRFIAPEIPAGGVDVFACTAEVRDVICSLESVHTSLVAQLFWVGFRRELVAYDRLPSATPSGWTMRRKLRYLSDSVFAFTDLPVRALWLIGLAGMALGVLIALAVVIAKVSGGINVPGYAATVLVIVFFGSLNMVGLGIIGSYVWRAYETAKGRPGAIVRGVVEPARDGERVDG